MSRSGQDAGLLDDVITVSRNGLRARISALVVVVALLLAGTLWGQDDDFPFGPFRMYATRDNPNGTVKIAAVEVVTADGAVHDVTSASGAPRRAEIEGRLAELKSDPELLRPLALEYAAGLSDPVEIRVVWQEYKLIDGRSQPPVDVVLSRLDLTTSSSSGLSSVGGTR